MMPDLIERGHLYIAQPPLYRFAVGKQERYLKDPEELRGHLLARAVEKQEVTLPDADAPIPSEDLMVLMKTYSRFEDLLDRQGKKGMPTEILNQVIEILGSRGLSPLNESSLEVLREELEKLGCVATPMPLPEEQRGYDLHIDRSAERQEQFRLRYSFLQSIEFRKLLELYAQLKPLHKAPYRVRISQKEVEVYRPEDLFQLLMDEAKKGASLQRYKGLGEMNPDQLWGTTMDPEKRTMHQVRIEDQYLADELFTTLMGDKVEPRRDFIQQNALDFRELDI
jgi:DNA gyrase subunit B